jgi:hypothetical protein
MPKDIFIDTNVIRNFANPMSREYKKLLNWLTTYNPNNKSNNAYLAISNKLLAEYGRSLRNCFYGSNSFSVIIDSFTKQDRFNLIKNREIKTFKQKNFKKHIVQRLRCNTPDRDHIPVVMLSDRKYALSLDGNFLRDVNNFPGFSARAVRCPQDLPYDQ